MIVSQGMRVVWLGALCVQIACDTTAPATTPVALTQVTAGTVQTCGLTSDGLAYCWGGAIGDGTTMSRSTATAVAMPAGETFTRVSAGGGHTCALGATGTAYCWGQNTDAQVGDGTTTDRHTPVQVVAAEINFDSISSGQIHTCGIATTGFTYCWGDNEFGQLGDGTSTDRAPPTRVLPMAPVTFTSIDAGWLHTCALTPAGAAYCWGENVDGKIGDGTTTNRLTPTAVAMPESTTFTSLAVGVLHTCALTAGGVAYCWGANHRGRLGDGTTTPRETPVPVALPAGITFTSIRAGYAHTCALTPVGSAYCWGRNVFGELGDGTTTEQRLTPTAVVMPTGVTFTSITVGFVHSCATTVTETVYCWGNNSNGRLGDGTTTNRSTPVLVVVQR